MLFFNLKEIEHALTTSCFFLNTQIQQEQLKIFLFLKMILSFVLQPRGEGFIDSKCEI